MSATLKDSAISPWEEAGILKNYVPPTDEELQEFEELSYELAKLSSQILCGKKEDQQGKTSNSNTPARRKKDKMQVDRAPAHG